MSLRLKTFIAIGITLLCLLLTLYGFSTRTLINGFTQVEEQELRSDLRRVQNAVKQTLNSAEETLTSWASWDEAYRYILDGNKNFEAVNFSDAALAPLHANFIIYVRPTGALRYGTGFDLTRQRKIPLPPSVKTHVLNNPRLLQHPQMQMSRTGLLMLPEGPTFIVARPILPTQNRGSSRGTMIVGHYLDKDEVARLSQVTHLSLSIYRADNNTVPADVRALAQSAAKTKAEEFLIQPVNAQQISGYVLMRDLSGRPALFWRITQNRTIYGQGLLSLRNLMLQIVTVGLVFGALALLIVERLVLARVGRLSGDMSNISSSGDVSRRVSVQGGDELSHLARDVNVMLASLNKTQQSLHESEARFRAFMDNSPIIAYVKDEEGRYIYANREFDQCFQITRGDWENKNDFELWPAAVAQAWRQDDLKVITSCKAIEFSETATIHDGEHEWISYKFPIVDADGRRLLAGISIDITARKRAEEAVRQSQRFLQATLDSLTSLIVILDESCTIIAVNKAWHDFAEANGYSGTAHAVGDNYLQVLQEALGETSSEVQQLTSGIHALMEQKQDHFSLEYAYHSPHIHCWFILHATRFSTDEATRVVIAHEDITKRKQAEEAVREAHSQMESRVVERTAELAQANSILLEEITERKRAEADLEEAKREAEAANHAKSEFLSRMSHELRTPLNAILGFSQLLELDELTPDQQESVAHISSGGRHLLQLINEVLDISRIETGTISLSLQPVCVREIVQEAIEMVRHMAERQNIRFESGPGLESEECWVVADRQRLKQVLLNLLSNAVKYNREAGCVTLSCELVNDDRWRIHVSDTGPGIPPEKLSRLFTFFDRLGAERSSIEGTGIGLALSRRLAQAMQGTLDVKSTLGEGSSFWIELPGADCPLHDIEHDIELALSENHNQNGNGHSQVARTVLYIEDNLINFRLIERILVQWPNVRLLTAIQGSIGLEMARQHHPDLILLDLHLPDMDGDKVFKLLQDDPGLRDIPVAVLSADATPGRISRLLAAGVQAYLTKPIKVQQVHDLLASTFHGHIEAMHVETMHVETMHVETMHVETVLPERVLPSASLPPRPFRKANEE